MEDAREARRKRLAERKTDRLAFITGQIKSLEQSAAQDIPHPALTSGEDNVALENPNHHSREAIISNVLESSQRPETSTLQKHEVEIENPEKAANNVLRERKSEVESNNEHGISVRGEDIISNVLEISQRQEPTLIPETSTLQKHEIEIENPEKAANNVLRERKNEAESNHEHGRSVRGEDIISNVLESSQRQEPTLRPETSTLQKHEIEIENPEKAANNALRERKNKVESNNEHDRSVRGEDIISNVLESSQRQEPTLMPETSTLQKHEIEIENPEKAANNVSKERKNEAESNNEHDRSVRGEDIISNVLKSSQRQEPTLRPETSTFQKNEIEIENPEKAESNEVEYNNEHDRSLRGEDVSGRLFTTSMLQKPADHVAPRATNATPSMFFTIFTIREISHSVTVTENIRLFITFLVAFLVVLSYQGFLVGGRIASSIISFRPLFLVLITDMTIILGWVLLNQGKNQRHGKEARKAVQENEGWANDLSRILEIGQVLYTVLGAAFLDCSICAVIILCGIVV